MGHGGITDALPWPWGTQHVARATALPLPVGKADYIVLIDVLIKNLHRIGV